MKSIFLFIAVSLIPVFNAAFALQNQDNSLRYFSQKMAIRFASFDLDAEVKSIFELKVGAPVEIPFTVEKKKKYAVGIATDHWVKGILLNLIDAKNQVIDTYSSVDTAEKNVGEFYFKTEYEGEYKLQVILTGTTIKTTKAAFVWGCKKCNPKK